MIATSRRLVAQIAAATIGFVVLASPALMIWWAGSNGSLGDLSEIELLGVGLLIALGASLAAGLLMGRAVDVAARDPGVGPLDPWAALFVGVIVLAIAVALIPAVALLVLLPDENTPLGSRAHWLEAIWVGGSLLAGAASIWSARRVLVHGRSDPGSMRPGERDDSTRDRLSGDSRSATAVRDDASETTKGQEHRLRWQRPTW